MIDFRSEASYSTYFKGEIRVKSAVLRTLMLSMVLLLLQYVEGISQVRVGIFTEKNVSEMLVSPTEGKYFLINHQNDTLYRFRSDDALSIISLADQLIVKTVYGLSDTLSEFKLLGSGQNARLSMRINNEKPEYTFFQSLKVRGNGGQLLLTNTVDLDRYVSRVVQAEVGYGAAEEYYKIQSIICRTYVMKNLERHTLEGFDVCDHEHCQVYSGLKIPTDEVIKATAATSGYVMVDSDNNLILSAFHANCGGQTANSEDVWFEPRSYLSSVEDTFCLQARSASWTKSVSASEFFTQIGFSPETALNEDWSYVQPDREKYFQIGNDSIELAKMRRFLNLRSTYFDINVTGNQVGFTGRGYGHGVGLCQQGAMKMAEHGYSYSQILGYYYKGAGLIQIGSLSPSK